MMASTEAVYNVKDEDAFACFGSSSSEEEEEEEEDDDNAIIEQRTALARGRHFVNTANHNNNSNNNNYPLRIYPVTGDDYQVVDTIGAGKGLQSCRTYACGDEILREVAVMRIPRYQAAATAEIAAEQHAEKVQKCFDRLHPDTRACVMDLSCCDDDDDGIPKTPLGVCKTNCFQLQNERDDGLFLTTSRLNHSCRPNANHVWRPDLQMNLVFATKDIAPGVDIYTTYGPPECLDTQGRRSYLEERFAFHCMCDMCQEGNSNGGDDRMVKIANLQETIGLLSGAGHHKEAIEAVDKCLQLLEEQGIGTGVFVKPILHYGYQISLMGLNDETRAMSYLKKEHIAVQHSEGIDSPKALKIQILLDRLLAA